MVIAPMTNAPSCPEFAELLSAYLDEALPPHRRQGVEAHLAVCADCGRALAGLRCTRRLLHELPGPSMPDRMKQHLLNTLRSRRLPRS